MVRFEDLMRGNYEDPGMWFLDFQDWFQFLPLFKQILLVLLIVLLAVGIAVLTYYILKGTAYLIYYIFKGLYYMFKFMFYDVPKWLFQNFLTSENHLKYKGVTNQHQTNANNHRRHLQRKYAQYNIKNGRSSSPSFAASSSAATTTTTITRTLHCPMCGQKFTSDMKSVLEKNARVYCEYCGYNLEMATR